MSSPIDRRTALRVGAGAVLGAISGCLSRDGGDASRPTDAAAGTPTATPASTETASSSESRTASSTPELTGTGTYADAPDGPESYPDRPTETSRDAALTYAREFEYARIYNSLHEPDVTDLSADARSTYDRAAHGGHYVLATGSGYANYEDGLHADWGQLPALYFVHPELVVRAEDLDSRYFHCSEVFAADDPDENFAAVCGGDDASYRVYNLSVATRSVSVSVAFLGADGGGDPVSVLEREYELATGAGVKQESVTYRRGTYRVTATLADGPTATDEWRLDEPPSDTDPPLTVLLTPVGGVRIGRPPFQSL